MRMPELAKALMDAQRIAVIAHITPDGDALGSALSVVRAMEGFGKQAVAVCDDLPPKMYAFLPGANRVVTPESLPFAPDCALLVDVSSADRAGRSMRISTEAPVRLLIDHHATTSGFDGLGVIDPNAGSTGELIVSLIDALGAPIDADMAVLLYTAIATDTGNFSFSNTTPQSLRAVARCLEAGLNLDEYNRRLFRSRSVARTKMIGLGLSHMETSLGGRIAYIRLTRAMFREADAEHEDTEGLVNYLAEMQGVEACFLAEERQGETKLSIRSGGSIDVAQVAQSMGGGGHARASGVTLRMPLDAASFRMLDALTRALDGEIA